VLEEDGAKGWQTGEMFAVLSKAKCEKSRCDRKCAGQIDDAKRVLKAAVQQDPQLRAVILNHPGLEAVGW